MKKLVLVALLGLVGASGGVATAAGTAAGNFDVNISLTAACQITPPASLDFTYTSFQTGAATATGGGFTVKCTNTLPYTIALDSTSVTDNAVGLAYTLGLSAAGGTGNGTDQSYTVTGSMAANQAGTCAAPSSLCTNAAATNKTRTLTVSY